MSTDVNLSQGVRENISKNALTGLLFSHGFMDASRTFLPQIQPNVYCMAAIDILNFRLFNKFRGRETGDLLLQQVAGCLEAVRHEHGGVTGYFGGDNFCIVMPWNMGLLEQLRDCIQNIITGLSSTIGVTPILGITSIDDPALPPEIFYDRAALALSHANARTSIVCYDPSMEDLLEEEMRLLVDVTDALERDEFTFYAQPQCDILTGKVVGAESLVRWIHASKGLIPPSKFVPAMERAGMIHLLDRQVWEKVCRWLRSWIDRGYHPVPISINISRIDIISMDVPTFLIHLLEKYDLPAKYIKAEITESAYAEEEDRVNAAVSQLRKAGFLVMMDDFGSGYSSLNMLKSVPVDVLKIDMRFLDIREQTEEQKGIGILESIVNMARLMGLPIIVEGVETLQQENILRNIGCRYTQGYYYYKPLPLDQFEEFLTDERRLDFTGLHCKQVESFHAREFMDGNLFTDTMVNSILGPAAIYDLHDNQIDIIRVNEQAYLLAGLDSPNNEDLSKRVWSNVRDDDRPSLLALFEKAYDHRPTVAAGYFHYLRIDNKTLWVRIQVFFLREKEGHRLYFVSLLDVTDLKERRQERVRAGQAVSDLDSSELKNLDRFCGGLPCGFALSRILLNGQGEPIDYDIVYINREMERMCGRDAAHVRHLILKAFGNDSATLLQKAYQAAFLGDRLVHYVYSALSNHYLELTLYQHEYGYAACTLRDVTHMQLYDGAFSSIVQSYREVYHINLQDNYCRMLYPNESLLTERGSYEGMVERHFGTGKILPHDESNVRHFLSLEHLRETLQTQNSVDFRYLRRGTDGLEEWCLTNVTVSEREDGKPKTAVLTIQSIDKLMKEEAQQLQSRMVEALATMSDAFFIYRSVDDERLLYANPAMMELFGCDSMEQLMEQVNGSFRGIVHPDDLSRVEWEIVHQIHNSDTNMDYVQYRIIRRDGQIRWVDDFGHLETSQWGQEHQLFYVFLKDITGAITAAQQEKLIKASRRYRNRALPDGNRDLK